MNFSKKYEPYQKDGKRQIPKSFELEFNETLQAMVLRILDTEGMYPCYFQDPEAGTYKIIKTSKGKLQMGK